MSPYPPRHTHKPSAQPSRFINFQCTPPGSPRAASSSCLRRHKASPAVRKLYSTPRGDPKLRAMAGQHAPSTQHASHTARHGTPRPSPLALPTTPPIVTLTLCTSKPQRPQHRSTPQRQTHNRCVMPCEAEEQCVVCRWCGVTGGGRWRQQVVTRLRCQSGHRHCSVIIFYHPTDARPLVILYPAQDNVRVGGEGEGGVAGHSTD